MSYENIPEIKEYFVALGMDKSVRTIEQYSLSARKFFDEFLKATTFEEVKKITSADCRNFQSHLLDCGMQKSSVNSYVRPLKAMFGWFVTNEMLETNPFAKVKLLKTDKKVVSFLTEDEISAMIKVCTRIQDKLIVAILITTGIRRNELINLKVKDVDGCHILVNGKGSKQRRLVLQPEVCELLNKYLVIRNKRYGDRVEELLVAKSGKKFTGSAIFQKIKGIMRNANIPEDRIEKLHVHSLRHTFVANLLGSGADIYTAQAALGHSSLNTTMIYAHLRSSALDNAMLNQKSIL